jgi:hypothetical protein
MHNLHEQLLLVVFETTRSKRRSAVLLQHGPMLLAAPACHSVCDDAAFLPLRRAPPDAEKEAHSALQRAAL